MAIFCERWQSKPEDVRALFQKCELRPRDEPDFEQLSAELEAHPASTRRRWHRPPLWIRHYAQRLHSWAHLAQEVL